MNNLLIVKAAPKDAEAILTLQREAYQSEARLYNDWTIPPLTQTLEELREEFRTSVVLTAVTNDSLVGAVRAHMAEGVVHIGRLIVTPAEQRKGIGSALLRNVEELFPSAARFELFTGSRSEDNIRLYRKHGYTVTHEETLSPSVTLVFMSKSNASTIRRGA